MIEHPAVLDGRLVDLEDLATVRTLFGLLLQEIPQAILLADQPSQVRMPLAVERYMSCELSHVQATEHAKQFEKHPHELVHIVLLIVGLGRSAVRLAPSEGGAGQELEISFFIE